jgi:hypothetical protein
MSGKSKEQAGSEEVQRDAAEDVQDSSASGTKEPQKDEQRTVEAKRKYRGLQFSAACISAEEVHITVENTASEGYSLGWVDGPVITCRTSDAEAYWAAEAVRIPAGETVDLVCYFEDLSGIPEMISISNVCMLNERGLPASGDMGGENVEISFKEDDGSAAENSDQQEGSQKFHGETSYGGLSIKADGDRTCIRITYSNETADGYCLGWVEGPTITCITTEGEYHTSAGPVKIPAGQTYETNYYFDDAAGDLISVRISHINSLDERGLPTDFSGGGTAEIVF